MTGSDDVKVFFLSFVDHVIVLIILFMIGKANLLFENKQKGKK